MHFVVVPADAILRRIEPCGNSKAHVCRPLGEPFWKLARCLRRISVPSLVRSCPRGAQENPVKLNQGVFVLLPVGKPRDSYYTTYS